MSAATLVHRHAPKGPCQTVCGAFTCDDVDTAYAHDAERVTCPDCTPSAYKRLARA